MRGHVASRKAGALRVLALWFGKLDVAAGSRLQIIIADVDPSAIAKILTHLHLSGRGSPRSIAWRLELLQAA